jgi:protein SCO1/2
MKFIWLLLLIPLTFVILFFVNTNDQKPLRTLPYFGKKRHQAAGDTNYHAVKAFSFINQYNETVTQQNVSGKIYVTDFFFTTCQSICPVMSTQLERVYKEFYNNNDVMILSHTVNPEEDSVAVLLRYADQHKVNNKQWLFLTGDKKQLYDLARQGYLLNAEEGNGGAEDFIHTQNFALVDREKHLRGFYDGTDSIEVTRLINDMHLLLDEYAYKEKHK